MTKKHSIYFQSGDRQYANICLGRRAELWWCGVEWCASGCAGGTESIWVLGNTEDTTSTSLGKRQDMFSGGGEVSQCLGTAACAEGLSLF